MARLLQGISRLFPGEVRFIAGLYLLLAGLFAALRLVLLVRNTNLAEGVATGELLKSFLIGARFDLAVASYLLIPLFLLLLGLSQRWRGRLVFGLGILTAALLLLGISEAEFYVEFESRYNALVYEYLSHPKIVGEMIWEGYPVVRYTLLWLLFAAVMAVVLRRLFRRYLAAPTDAESPRGALLRIMGTTLTLAAMVVVLRGGITGEPLRWGDAFFSESTFANHLALNGLFTLGRSGWDKIYSKQAFWAKSLPADEALATSRAMLALPGETSLADEQHPLLRAEPQAAPLGDGRPLNVVVILMESFSARFVGAMGAERPLTPEFDRLAEGGILFERAFSNGTHTHQGVYATLTSFPNLPGYEYLMKMMEASQEFSGLPTLLSRRGYDSIFLYNGLLSWDNKEGFLRQHGIDRFVGTDDYVNPTFVDPVWGVSDYDVYARANEEFKALAAQGPFFGSILTLSNHAPFNLPEPLPFERIRSDDGYEGRYNGMRYADWALGEFFRMAEKEDYFKDTLFVVTGDHGFGYPPMITPMALGRFHVPLLFYAPGLLDEPGLRRRTVASQVDIGPSVLGLLGVNAPHQGWGRNLFSPTLQDEGFAVIKPSGGEELVALIEGDRLLLVAPKEKPEIYRYDLGFPPVGSEDRYRDEKDLAKEMEKRLLAYVQTGILSLRARNLGLPDGEVARLVQSKPVAAGTAAN
ncbi:LTA synthase family protein [Trichloromonas sp.]|uniref:LTA synthase family protein n=1 Tax=Trichloromonas sp. TaxID=3069249 RepID=UPI002A387BF1|nr:sulfatase-like hydrolase/transferase [Trichloromonas sp.]